MDHPGFEFNFYSKGNICVFLGCSDRDTYATAKEQTLNIRYSGTVLVHAEDSEA